jgi:hypothetical protein
MPIDFMMLGLQDKYRDEIINPNDELRRTKLTALEQRLQTDLRDLALLQEALQSSKERQPPTGQGFVRRQVERWTDQGENRVQQELLTNHIFKIRRWLSRQGAKVTPDGFIVWEKSKATVAYDKDLAQQEATRVQIDAGRFLLPDGKPVDTRDMVTAAMGPGYAIYVVSGEGHLHLTSHATGKRHHSSLLAGRDVACAGELKVTLGTLEWIGNKSGHYEPIPCYMAQILVYFANIYHLDPASYRVTTYKPETVYESGTQFLEDMFYPSIPDQIRQEIPTHIREAAHEILRPGEVFSPYSMSED